MKWFRDVFDYLCARKWEQREEPVSYYPFHVGRGDTVRLGDKSVIAKRGATWDDRAALERWMAER